MRKPVGAVVSQVVVALTSMLLSLIVARQMGAVGLGAFGLLFSILITANAVQTGWIGDSLTVLDRFDPGVRAALFRSQGIALVAIACSTAVLGSFVDGVDATTALVFGLACAAWALEETIRRILIARREFWSLVVNDAAFAIGALGVLGLVIVSPTAVTLLTVVSALLGGAIVAIAAGVAQLPRVELLRGPAARPRQREVASFAGWRAVQVALRPGSQAIVRAAVATLVSIEAVGHLEAARLVIAPALTIVNGAGVYLLPTYSRQARDRNRLRPTAAAASALIGGAVALYVLVAVVFADPLSRALLDGDAASRAVTTAAIAAWGAFAISFGIGVAPGSALVARGRSRRTFTIRAVDAAVGVTIATACAAFGWVDAVPLGLAAGSGLGAWLLVRALAEPGGTPARHEASAAPAAPAAPAVPGSESTAVLTPARWTWLPDAAPTVPPPPPAPPIGTRRPAPPDRAPLPPTVVPLPPSHRRVELRRDLLWIVPLVLIVATEYKVRRRSIHDVLTGRIDPMIAAELVIYAVVGVWALWRLVPRRHRVHPLMMVMWGYALTTAASAVYSEFPLLALARAVELVIIACVIQLVGAEGDFTTIRRLLHGWVVLVTASIVVGLAYVAPTTGPQEGRFTWLSVHSVAAGSMLATTVPVLFGLWAAAGRRSLQWPRWAYGALLVTHTVFLLLTRTRGSIGGAAVAIAVMAWLLSGVRMKPELVLGSLVAGGALALAFGRPVLEFLTRGETADQLGTFNRRTEIWALAWRSFLYHPVFGLGFNAAKGAFFEETQLGGAHNSAISVMIDVGAVGLVWWLALVVGTLVVLGRLRYIDRRSPVLLRGATGTARSDGVILIGVLVALLVNSITTEGLGAAVNVMAIWWYLGAAWLAILDRDQASALAPTRTLGDHGTRGGDGRSGIPRVPPVQSLARSR